MTLRPPLSTEFRKHYVLSGGTQRRALPHYQSEEIKILNISFPRIGMEPTACPSTVARVSICVTTGLET